MPRFPYLIGFQVFADHVMVNDRIVTEVQVDGRAFLSGGQVRGRSALRACIANFRTQAHDIDALLRVVEEIGARVSRD